MSGTIDMVVKLASHVIFYIRRIVDVVLIILLCSIVSLIMFQILGRYVFNYSISWSEEAATFCQIWLVMLGSGLAMRNRNHIGIDLLVTRLPLRVQQVAKTASFLLGVWFLLVVITSSMSLLAIGLIVKSAGLGLPLVVPYVALPVGMSYLLLEFAIATIPDIRGDAPAPQPMLGD